MNDAEMAFIKNRQSVGLPLFLRFYSGVVLRGDSPQQFQRKTERTHKIYVMFEEGETIKGHSFCLNRNENPSRCAKSVQRKDSDVRRTVDKNDIEVILVVFKKALDSRMGFQVLRDEGNCSRKVKASWNDGEIVYSCGMNEVHLRRKRGFEESAQREGRLEWLFRKKTCSVALRIRVDEKYAKTFMSENSRKVDARGGFAHSAFLIGD